MAEAKETQNILKQIYSSSSSVSKMAEENSNTLQSIYKLQVESEKRRKAAAQKAEAEARRKLRDDKRDDLDTGKQYKKEKKELKKEGKTLGDKIKEGLMGLLGGIGPIIAGKMGSLLSGIAGILGKIGSGIIGALGKLGPLLGKMLGGLKGFLGPILGKAAAALAPIAPIVAAVAGMGAAFAGGAALAGLGYQELRSMQAGGSDLREAHDVLDARLKEDGMNRGGVAGRHTTRGFKPKGIRNTEQEEQYLLITKQRKELRKIQKEREENEKKKTEEVAAVSKSAGSGRSKDYNDEEKAQVEAINKKYEELAKGLSDRINAVLAMEVDKDIKSQAAENVAKAKKERAERQAEINRRQAPYVENMRRRQRSRSRRSAVRRQSGGEIPGAFTVPGSGAGDQFPIDLPAGSFVLNREASKVLPQMLQRGGMTNMVSTLLEPGERVFLPGQWENSGIAALNSAVSRFQTGGQVESAMPLISSMRGGSESLVPSTAPSAPADPRIQSTTDFVKKESGSSQRGGTTNNTNITNVQQKVGGNSNTTNNITNIQQGAGGAPATQHQTTGAAPTEAVADAPAKLQRGGVPGVVQVQRRQSGGLILFQGHGDVPSGSGIAPGTDGPGTPIQGKFKPTAEQHFVHQVATKAEQLSKSKGANVTYQRSMGKFKDASAPNSNWSQIAKHRAAGKAAVELHFDAWGYDGGNYIEGKRGMLTGGQGKLHPEEKALQQKFGTHPSSSSKGWGALMLELDPLKYATSRVDSYAKMIVDAVSNSKKGSNSPGPATGGGEPQGGQVQGTEETVKVKEETGSARGEDPGSLKPPAAAVKSGGQQSQTEQGDGASGEEEKEEGGNKVGVKAIVAAAEKGAAMKIGQGQNMQCANTTRQVLRMAGHPDAGKTTKKGDLDPEGLKYSGASFAASFAGSDMGTIKKSTSALAPGDIVLWKNTFSSMGGDKPGAITHVGIKGEGNDVYDHGMSPGWRKRPMWDGGKFAYGVTLTGNGGAASAFGDGGVAETSSGASDGAGGGAPGSDALKTLTSGLFAGSETAKQVAGFLGATLGFFASIAGGGSGAFKKQGDEMGTTDVVQSVTSFLGDLNSGGKGDGQEGSQGEGESSGGGEGGGGETSAVSGNAGSMVAGAKMIMEAGVPKKGAAYLAGNIQQESSWNGQRDWGQVMGDGTSRNGGLVSWASWSDNPARLGKIEKYLGKNITEASDGEQIGAMLWEMKRDYPGAYATFMNPKATDAQLRAASYKYWGYGHEGPRYQYATETLSQLQRGGVVPKKLQTGGVIGTNLVTPMQPITQKLQSGGRVNMSKVTSKLEERMQTAQRQANIHEAEEMSTLIVAGERSTASADPAGATVVKAPSTYQKPPILPDGCSATMAADYTYDITLGGYV